LLLIRRVKVVSLSLSTTSCYWGVYSYMEASDQFYASADSMYQGRKPNFLLYKLQTQGKEPQYLLYRI
jgi:hypothetical protein